MADRVRIVHPKHPGAVGNVSLAAFERRSSKLGWIRADAAPADVREAADNPGPAPDERALLVAEAESLGLKVHPRAKPDTIRRQIEKAKADL